MESQSENIFLSTKNGYANLGTPFAGAHCKVVNYTTYTLNVKTNSDNIKITSTHTVISLACSSAGMAGKFGAGIDLLGYSTTLWYLRGLGTTKGITGFATST